MLNRRVCISWVILVFCGSTLADTSSALKFSEPSRELEQYFAENIQSLNWTQIIPSHARVIYFGENHMDLVPKHFLQHYMKNMAEAGVTHLALEMFNAHSQNLLSRFSEGEASEQELVDVLTQEWSWPIVKYYIPAIQAAVDLNIQLVALDNRKEQPNTRDEFMAARLADVLKESPEAKIAVWIGRPHVLCSTNFVNPKVTQPQILKSAHGIESVSYGFERWTGPRGAGANDLWGTILQKLGIKESLVYLPTPCEQTGFHGVIFTHSVDKAGGLYSETPSNLNQKK